MGIIRAGGATIRGGLLTPGVGITLFHESLLPGLARSSRAWKTNRLPLCHGSFALPRFRFFDRALGKKRKSPGEIRATVKSFQIFVPALLARGLIGIHGKFRVSGLPSREASPCCFSRSVPRIAGREESKHEPVEISNEESEDGRDSIKIYRAVKY